MVGYVSSLEGIYNQSPCHPHIPLPHIPDPEDVPSEPQTSRGKISKFGESMVWLINAADEKHFLILSSHGLLQFSATFQDPDRIAKDSSQLSN